MANPPTTAKGATKSTKGPATGNKTNRGKPSTQGTSKKRPANQDENNSAEPSKRVNTGARNGSSNGNALTARTNTGDGRSQPDTDVDMIMQKLAEMEG